MKKRVICMLLSVLIALSLAACGKEPDSAAAFSVTEETIRAALEKTDLPEVLCPEETETLGDDAQLLRRLLGHVAVLLPRRGGA